MFVNDNYKKFITKQIDALSKYDALRPDNHVYEFHLHSERVAQSMKKLSIKMGNDKDISDALYWATLPHDIGKILLPIQIWDLDDKPTEHQRNERRSHTWQGIEIIKNEFGKACNLDPFLMLLIDIMKNHHEAIDGSGHHKITGDHMSQEVRMVCICDAFDGYSIKRPHFGDRDISPESVIKRMEVEKSGQFDLQILEKFKETVL